MTAAPAGWEPPTLAVRTSPHAEFRPFPDRPCPYCQAPTQAPCVAGCPQYPVLHFADGTLVADPDALAAWQDRPAPTAGTDEEWTLDQAEVDALDRLADWLDSTEPAIPADLRAAAAAALGKTLDYLFEQEEP